MLLGTEKIKILTEETPIHYLANISKELGIEFYIKRDDLTPLGMGGNKLRKLEYLLYEAVEQKSTMLITFGGAQTNHGRLTAAVAAKFGLKCAILCIDDYPGEMSANLLLDRIMGAEVILKKNDGTDEGEQLAKLSGEVKARYETQGERIYEIPTGGSNVKGMLGYYECAMEITKQAEKLQISDARVISAVGSLGTYLGLYCGLKNENSPLSLTGIAISPFGEYKENRIMEYFEEAKKAYHLSINAKRNDFDIETGYTMGGYNNPCKEVRDAIYFMARKEAILLDPCYTGKAFAGICSMIKEGKIKKGEKIIFVHTGGTPAIYTKHHRLAMEEELSEGITIIE